MPCLFHGMRWHAPLAGVARMIPVPFVGPSSCWSCSGWCGPPETDGAWWTRSLQGKWGRSHRALLLRLEWHARRLFTFEGTALMWGGGGGPTQHAKRDPEGGTRVARRWLGHEVHTPHREGEGGLPERGAGEARLQAAPADDALADGEQAPSSRVATPSAETEDGRDDESRRPGMGERPRPRAPVGVERPKGRGSEWAERGGGE